LLVSNKKKGLAIPLQLAEVGVSSPAKMKEKIRKLFAEQQHTEEE